MDDREYELYTSLYAYRNIYECMQHVYYLTQISSLTELEEKCLAVLGQNFAVLVKNPICKVLDCENCPCKGDRYNGDADYYGTCHHTNGAFYNIQNMLLRNFHKGMHFREEAQRVINACDMAMAKDQLDK